MKRTRHKVACHFFVYTILLLLSLALTACGPGDPSEQNKPDASGEQSQPDTPARHNALVVQSQHTSGSEVVIERLSALKKSWLYIAKRTTKSPSDVFAIVAIEPGTKTQWKVPLDNPIESTTQVLFALHVDDGDNKFDPKKDAVARGDFSKRLSFPILIKFGSESTNMLVIEDQSLLEGANEAITVKQLVSAVGQARVVIFQDKAGKPGELLGRALKSKGDHKDFKIQLSEALTTAQTLHAILYSGAGTWSINTPILKDKDDKEIKLTFQISVRSTNQGATLKIDDQLLTRPFDTITAREVSLPDAHRGSGRLVFYADDKGKRGEKIGEGAVQSRKVHTNASFKLTRSIVGNEVLHAALVDTAGKPFTDDNNNPLETTFQAQGDLSQAGLIFDSQELPSSDLRTLKLQYLSIPTRYRAAWVALYADDKGKPGQLVHRLQYKPGEQEDITFRNIRDFAQTQVLHAALHEGRGVSNVWNPANPLIKTIAGAEVRATFRITSEAFVPILEIADQTLAGSKIKVSKIKVPQAYFYGVVAIYEDDNGKRGKYLASLSSPRGTRSDKSIQLPPLQGEHTLHGVLHIGQKWTGSNPVMTDDGGNEIAVTFKIGAREFNYIDAPDFTTDKPTKVLVKRAYAQTEQTWVVIARDDNGKPGLILGKKRVPPRFSGRVFIDLDAKERTHEYLRGNGFRRAIQGEETVHVLLFADNPKDNKFTYTPGGSEDKPLLNSKGQPVSARMKVTVKGSIDNSQAKSPYFYKPCTFSQFKALPTKLPVDCRCNRVSGGAFPNCCLARVPKHYKFKYGKGPQVSPLNYGRFKSGFVEKSSNELISVVSWLDINKRPEHGLAVHVGMVMAIHMDTGDRRIISGLYKDTTKGIYDTGKGPLLSYPFDIQKGPDGKYYVAAYGYTRAKAGLNATLDIIRVDPKTGERTYAWRSNHLGSDWAPSKSPYGHCANGRNATNESKNSLQFGRKAFAMDPKGNFYLSYANNGKNSASEGIGIARISADGKKCEIITSSDVGSANTVYKGKNIGSGPKPQAGPYQGMLYKDGALYAAVFVGAELYKIDVATGKREIVYKQGQHGFTWSPPGNRIKWDPHRKLIWLNGLGPQTLLFDPKTGDNAPLNCPQNNRDFRGIRCMVQGTPAQTNLPVEHGFWLHPTNPDIVFLSRLFTIVKYEVSTGNNYIWTH